MVISLSCFRVKAVRHVVLGCICLAWPSTSSPPLNHAVLTVMISGPTTFQVHGLQNAHRMGWPCDGLSVRPQFLGCVSRAPWEGRLRRTLSMKVSVGVLMKHRQKLPACLCLKGLESTRNLKACESPTQGFSPSHPGRGMGKPLLSSLIELCCLAHVLGEEGYRQDRSSAWGDSYRHQLCSVGSVHSS